MRVFKKFIGIDFGKSIVGASVKYPNAKVYCAWENPTIPSF